MSKTLHIDALAKHGSVRKAATALDIPRTTFFDNLQRERAVLESVRAFSETQIDPVRNARTTRYYVFTCAVRGAPVHTDFLDNLKAYADHLGGELVIGALTSMGKQRYADYEEEEFDPAVAEFISNDPLVIGDRVRFSPELNLTPTMVKPLQGLQTYTKHMWGIFPHTKISLETVATHKDRPAKFIATTGAVTHPSYSPTKAGYRAHFDHVHGAIVLEVTKRGVWFRHVTPANEADGTFYDLDKMVRNGKITTHSGVDALIYGDIHIEKIDQAVLDSTWGPVGARPSRLQKTLVESLRPRTQVFHDLMDMTAANYHELDNLFARYHSWYNGTNKVDEACITAAEFLAHVSKLAPENVVVASNHDDFIEKWLLKFDPQKAEDFDNIEEFYALKVAFLKRARSEVKTSVLQTTLETILRGDDLKSLDGMRFLRYDESFEIQDIECGWHGHQGPNGRRGSKASFKYVTEKSTIAHLHSPSIESGCHVVGTSTLFDLDYNKGPSSWAHTHGIIYPHGGRTLVTLSDGRFWSRQNPLYS